MVLLLGQLTLGWALSSSPFDLLAADQYAAQARRSEVERILLCPEGSTPQELLEPKFDLAAGGGGGGFGGGTKKWSKRKALAEQQKQRLIEDGVLRINGALKADSCVSLRKYVIQEIETTAALHKAALSSEGPSVKFSVEDYYGIEPGRSSRTDLLLSLQSPEVSGALRELFHAKTGKLRDLYEALVTNEGVLYEMASVVTSQGSDRQCIHPDVPFQSESPLYVVFLALQDVTPDMGPTTFLVTGNTETANTAFDSKGDTFDSYLAAATPREACLKAGDLVVFDARVLHCGNANFDVDRALFNFSFRNPAITGDIGYKGSMRPAYTRQQIQFQDIMAAVDAGNKKAKKKKNAEEAASPFAQYGDGLS